MSKNTFPGSIGKIAVLPRNAKVTFVTLPNYQVNDIKAKTPIMNSSTKKPKP